MAGIKNNKFSGKALLLLGIYLMHFGLFLGFVADFSQHYHHGSKTLFSSLQKESSPNSFIATFRTLEKHEVSQPVFKINPDHSIVIQQSNVVSSIIRPDEQLFTLLGFYLPDTSYSIYLRDCVFRI